MRLSLALVFTLSLAVSSSRGNAQNISATEQQQLFRSDPGPGDLFGDSIDLCGDTVVIGARWHDEVASDAGAAYVFVRTGSTWVEEVKLTASDGALDDQFGFSVSISGDTAAISSLPFSFSGLVSGAAYVFVRNGSTWVEQAKLTTVSGGPVDKFGSSVSISGDTLVVGASRTGDGAGNRPGAAHVFVRNGTAWTHEATLAPSDGTDGNEFGFAVAVSGDTVVVGAPAADGASPDAGAAYVFARSGGAWTERAKITAGDGAPFALFGWSVATTDDTAVVGAPFSDVLRTVCGAAYVFVEDGSSWSEEAKLVASDGAMGDQLGTAVSVSGSIALVGAPWDGDTGGFSGSAYIFSRDGTTWIEQVKITASNTPAGALFGDAVSISESSLAVGASAGGDRFSTGAAYVFTLGPSASLAVRNADPNPDSYAASEPPVLGSTIDLTVDLTTTGHSFAALFATTDPVNATLANGQVLLIGGFPVFTLPLAPGPIATYSVAVPNDPAIAGFTLHTQAVHIQGVAPFALSNAVDLMAGF